MDCKQQVSEKLAELNVLDFAETERFPALSAPQLFQGTDRAGRLGGVWCRDAQMGSVSFHQQLHWDPACGHETWAVHMHLKQGLFQVFFSMPICWRLGPESANVSGLLGLKSFLQERLCCWHSSRLISQHLQIFFTESSCLSGAPSSPWDVFASGQLLLSGVDFLQYFDLDLDLQRGLCAEPKKGGFWNRRGLTKRPVGLENGSLLNRSRQ